MFFSLFTQENYAEGGEKGLDEDSESEFSSVDVAEAVLGAGVED